MYFWNRYNAMETRLPRVLGSLPLAIYSVLKISTLPRQPLQSEEAQ
jgi:hypothetical protein